MPAVVSRNPVLVETIVLLYKWAIPPLVNLMTDELKSCQMLPASGIAMVHAVNRMFGCVLQTHWASACQEEEGREGGEGGEGNRGRSSSSQSMRSVEEDGGATTTEATEATEAALTDEQRITLIDSMFLFSCVWSIGASLTQEGRVSFNDSFRTLCSGNDERYRPPRPFESKGSMIPGGGTGGKSVFDYFLAVEVLGNSGGQRVQWTTWTDLIKEEITAPLPLDLRFDQIVVPTCEGRCLKELLDVLVTYAQHPLVIGGSGTGKTVYLQNFLNDRMLVKTKTSDTATMGGTMGGSMGSGEKAEYCLKTMQFSTFTTPPDIQTNVLEGMLKRKGSRTITSKSSQKTLFIIDDINMPEKEEYGAQPPLELIRQGTATAATAATAATESTVCMYCCELLLLLL